MRACKKSAVCRSALTLRFVQHRDSVMIGTLTVDGGPLHLVLQAGSRWLMRGQPAGVR